MGIVYYITGVYVQENNINTKILKLRENFGHSLEI